MPPKVLGHVIYLLQKSSSWEYFACMFNTEGEIDKNLLKGFGQYVNKVSVRYGESDKFEHEFCIFQNIRDKNETILSKEKQIEVYKFSCNNSASFTREDLLKDLEESAEVLKKSIIECKGKLRDGKSHVIPASTAISDMTTLDTSNNLGNTSLVPAEKKRNLDCPDDNGGFLKRVKLLFKNHNAVSEICDDDELLKLIESTLSNKDSVMGKFYLFSLIL